MKRWLWFFSALLISTGVYFTIRYGLRPKPIPVLNPTLFENPQQIGAVIYKRLRQEILTERILLLGSDPQLLGYQEVWTGLLKTALADDVKIDVFYQRENLEAPESVGRWESIPFNLSMIGTVEFIAQVSARMNAGHLVVIHALTSEVSHLMQDSLSRGFDKAIQHPVLALSTIALTLQPGEQERLQSKCLGPASEPDGLSRMECAEARVTKTLMKKKPLPGNIWAVMERHGLKEYLVFVHR